jgi:hypothetical protein
MRMCYRIAGLAPALLLAAGLIAQAGPKVCVKKGCCRPVSGRLVVQTYPVADLVIPVDRGDVTVCIGKGKCRAEKKKPSSRTQEAELIKRITSTVAPGSWASKGGRGTIDYYPQTMALVVNQTAEVQEMVADVLETMRRKQEVEVAVQLRLVTVPEETWKWVGSPPVQTVSREALIRLFKLFQCDGKCNIMQAPKMTLFPGQKADLRIIDEVVGLPPSMKGEPGWKVSVRPVVSADRRSVSLEVGAKWTALDRGPVVTACCEEGQPVPVRTSRAVNARVKLADGHTVMLLVGRRVREWRHEYGPPILSQVPYVNRLFKNVGHGREPEAVLVAVTPKIIVQEEEEEVRKEESPCPYMRQKDAKVRPSPSADEFATFEENMARIERRETAARAAATIRKRVEALNALHAGEESCEKPSRDVPALRKDRRAVQLVKEYRRACAEGRLAEATSLAVQALALDPTCFSGK